MAVNDSLENIAINNDAKDYDDNIVSQNGKIYSVEGECIFDGPYQLSITENNQETREMIDFEDLIDFSLVSVQDIKELKSALNSFEASEEDNSDVMEALSLAQVNNYFEEIISETSCFQDNSKEMNIKTEDTEDTTQKEKNTEVPNLNNNDCKVKLETQYNDAAIFIDLTTDSEDISTIYSKEDIISISSEDHIQSNDSDGYESSDFQFITEAEAKLSGYLIKFSNENSCNLIGTKDDKVKREHCINEGRYKNTSPAKEELNSADFNAAEDFQGFYTQEDNDINKHSWNSCQSMHSHTIETERNNYVSDPGEGPSGLNGPLSDYSNRDYRQNHRIPEEEGYLDLFQGAFNPILSMSDIILLENKSVRPSPMNIQYDGVGFDKQFIWHKCQPDSSEDEYEEEAKESIEKILFMYPYNNRKPKRKRF